MINLENLFHNIKTRAQNFPFYHVVIDDFCDLDLARQLEKDFIDYHSDGWLVYDNAVQVKKLCADWHRFPSQTYQFISYAIGQEFLTMLGDVLGHRLLPDPGLNASGWHIHDSQGKLTPHLDYNLHPRLNLQRKYNIIVYLTENYKEEYGGHLGFYEGGKTPGNLVYEITPKFNRAVLFDTTNSWHGISRACNYPSGIYRKSIALYYLIDPGKLIDNRDRALFFLDSFEGKIVPHLTISRNV